MNRTDGSVLLTQWKKELEGLGGRYVSPPVADPAQGYEKENRTC